MSLWHFLSSQDSSSLVAFGGKAGFPLEVVPGARRMATLADANSSSPQQLQALHDAAHARGVELLIYQVTKTEEIPDAIDAAKKSGARSTCWVLHFSGTIVRSSCRALRRSAFLRFIKCPLQPKRVASLPMARVSTRFIGTYLPDSWSHYCAEQNLPIFP